MLTPQELLEIVDTMYPLLDELNGWIAQDLIKRLMARMARGEDLTFGASDKWQLQLYQEAGGHYEALTQQIVKWTKKSDAEVAAIFEDAGLRAWMADDAFYTAQSMESTPLLKSESLMKILVDTYQRTNGEIHNFTRTTARNSEQRFMNVCDKAHLKVVTGAQSYTAAVKEAVDELAGSQLEVKYPSGHVDTIETAVLRCVRTGTAQASGNLSLQGMEERGWDVILVSAHLGARYGDGGENPGNHFWWQGKHYSRTGATPDLPLFEVTGYGTGEGLCGWNCRHSFGPGNVGHNPYKEFDAEENKKAYDLSQRQRAMECDIRHSKTKLLGYRTAIDNCTDPETKAALQTEYDRASLRLREKNKAYNDFCEQNGLKRYDDRLRVARWNRSEASKAAQAARRSSAPAEDKPTVTPPTPTQISSAVQRLEVTHEYADGATPGVGEITYDPEYPKADRADEISTAEWVKDHIGGDIRLLKEVNEQHVKTPDYLWRGKFWDQKATSSEAAANTAVQRGLKQIKSNPGGVILDYNIKKCDVVWEDLLAVIDKRMQWYHDSAPIDILVVFNGGAYRVIRYSKR